MCVCVACRSVRSKSVQSKSSIEPKRCSPEPVSCSLSDACPPKRTSEQIDRPGGRNSAFRPLSSQSVVPSSPNPRSSVSQRQKAIARGRRPGPNRRQDEFMSSGSHASGARFEASVHDRVAPGPLNQVFCRARTRILTARSPPTQHINQARQQGGVPRLLARQLLPTRALETQAGESSEASIVIVCIEIGEWSTHASLGGLRLAAVGGVAVAAGGGGASICSFCLLLPLGSGRADRLRRHASIQAPQRRGH